MKRPRLDIAPVVSREHGELFAEKFFAVAGDSEAPSEAFALTRLIVWPCEESDPAAVDRYNVIADEIRAITFELSKRHMAETFVAVAQAVLDRERLT